MKSKALRCSPVAGSSLALVLVVTTLAFLAAFVMAGSTSAHLGFTNKASQSLRARNLAEAAITQAVAALQADPDFGKSDETIQIVFPENPEGSEGLVSFDPEAPVYSTYNLDADNSRPGFHGRLVPPQSVHIVGVGRCREATRTVETIVSLPPYPYAIASSGPIESDGELLVGSIDPEAGSGIISAEDLRPAHLASNDPAATSVQLGADTTIIGDVQSVGGLRLTDGAVIKGQTLAYGQPVALPEIELGTYDPEGGASSYQELPPYLTDTTIHGVAKAPGDLAVFGDLDLNQGKLYVEGHLTVRGQILGQGLVVARKGAEIFTGARISGGQAVLLSGGDVSIQGGGPLGSFFQGLVYTEGHFQARDITVVGSFISRGDGSGVKLSNARVLGDVSQTSWEPGVSTSFYFVASGSRNEPAIRVSGPTEGSFSIEVRLTEADGEVSYGVTDPQSAEVKTFKSLNAAVRHIALLANDTARLMRLDKEPTSEGKNLVAAAETLEESLTNLSDTLRSDTSEGFDINRFLSLAERLKVTHWREI